MPTPALTLAEPLLLPHVVPTAEVVLLSDPVVLTFTLAVAEHPPLAITVTVYAPAAILLIVDAVPPLLQLYVNGLSPVVVVTLAEPVLLVQLDAVDEGDNVTPVPVEITVTDALAEQPAAPVTVTL